VGQITNMNKLTKIFKGNFGTKYALNGVIPFASVNMSELEYGDSIQDNGGKGMIMYVNQCCECRKKFFGGTLVLVANECKDCYTYNRFTHLNEYDW